MNLKVCLLFIPLLIAAISVYALPKNLQTSIEPLVTLRGDAGFDEFTLSQDGGRLIAATDVYGYVAVWKRDDASFYLKFYAGHFQGVLSLGINPNTSEIITVGSDKYVTVFDINTKTNKFRIPIIKARYSKVSSDGRYVAVISENSDNIIVYDIEKAKNTPNDCVAFVTKGDPIAAAPFIFFNDNLHFATICSDKSVRIYNVNKQSSDSLIINHVKLAQKVYFIGPILLMIIGYPTAYSNINGGSPAGEATYIVWNTEKNKIVNEADVKEKDVFQAFQLTKKKGDKLMAQTNDEKYILVRSKINKVQLWNSDNYKKIN